MAFSVSDLRAACIDGDDDGYGFPASTECTYDLEDCNDNDATIHPGAVEVCGDDIDNNCNGLLHDPEDWSVPESCIDSTVLQDGTEAGIDNDCDGFANKDDPGCVTSEICDGYDNNWDGLIDEGFYVGSPCSAGEGVCTRSGVIICREGAAICSASPGISEIESFDTADTCSDGQDNDCDGFFDLADADCMQVPGESIVFAASASSDDCIDNDGDGYGFPASTDCTYSLADCNDGDAAIFPGGPCTITGGDGCLTGSLYATDGSCSCPVPEQGLNTADTEAWTDPASCTDGRDNDCDGLADKDDAPDCNSPEICDGYDNDWYGTIDDGFNVGDPCSVGLGICERSGTLICSGDGLTSQCSASVGVSKTESIDFANSCSDGKDNDCDGLVDSADVEDCSGDEICDGIDNNLNGTIDEGFTNLGDTCFVGLGACENSGQMVCSADGLTTECNVFPLSANIEGPSGPSCSDGMDNDCDGLTDTADISCDAAAAELYVFCTLPYTNGKPGSDCTGKHFANYGIAGGSEETVIQAEFLGLSPDGEILGVLPDVQVGDRAHLASRLDPDDFKMSSKTNVRGTRHEVFAPVPLLHVIAHDGDAVAEAYCSNIPYLDVIRPDGTVISVSSGNVTEVTTAIPLVDSASLDVQIDCVDVLASLGIDPSIDFPGGPYSGFVDVDGQLVTVEDLYVDVAEDVYTESSNTLTMTLKNLGGGGHIVYVNGEPVPQRDPLTEECLKDDIADTGTVSMLAVAITSPADQEIVDPVPWDGVHVAGYVQHGREIAGLKLSGKDVDVTGQMFTAGDGICSADQYVLDFDEPLAETDLNQAIAGTALPGTLQRGSNNIIADVSDDLGNRGFATRMFGLGNVLSPAQSALFAQTVETAFQAELTVIKNDIMTATETEVENAFVAGLEADAVEKVFDKLLADSVTEFKNRAKATWDGRSLGDISIDPDCSCKVTATLRVTSLTFGTESDAKVDFKDGEFDVIFELPDVTIAMAASNSCETTFLGACVAETVLNITAKTLLIDPDFTFTINEDGIKNNTLSTDDDGDEMKTFVIGTLRYPGSLTGDNLENNIAYPPYGNIWTTNSDINCLGASICSFFEGMVGFTIHILTFGIVDPTDVFDFISVDWQLADFEDLAGSSDPEPVGIGEMAIDDQVVEDFGQAAFAPTLTDVEITEEGLTAAFSAVFTTQVEDPDVEETPGAVLTPAPAPGLPQGTSTQNGYIVLADDTINQLFASMAKSGGLKTTCQDTEKTVGDLLPPDCESLTGETELATATIQGICHGVRGTDCETLTASTLFLQGTKQGACHGSIGDECTTIPVSVGSILAERTACNLIPDVNLTATDPLLFCAKQSIPPQLLINNDNSSAPTDELDTTLLLNDMTVSMVVDRSTAGLEGELGGIPNCFAADASSLADCNLYAACIDITLATGMSLDNSECLSGETGFVFSLKENGITTSGIEAGVVCGAATQTDDTQVTGEAAEDDTVAQISENVEYFTPPLCAKGLTLGDLLNFQNHKLISIDTGGPDAFADYFGIIGEISP